MRVLYVQYTNPCAYPPLEHSSRILARAGWRVRFLGTGRRGAGALDFPPHENIELRRWRFYPPGLRQKIHYIAFALWCLWSAILWRPQWVYASDPLSCPIALMLRRLGFRVLYHEHDSPGAKDASRPAFQRFVRKCRHSLARAAHVCVLPNERRVEAFLETTRRVGPTFCVWNCPRADEVRQSARASDLPFTLHYHGNISPDLLPEALIPALAQVPEVTLQVVGYTTMGFETYPEKLRALAGLHGVEQRVVILPAIQRAELLSMAARATVGWAAMPLKSDNQNFTFMAGASNKAFDYLACGLAVLVSDLPDWKEMFVAPGYGRACVPNDSGSIASALRWFVRNRGEATLMGKRGQQRISADWNYERQFEQVSALLRK